jgi:hypothetical protein
MLLGTLAIVAQLSITNTPLTAHNYAIRSDSLPILVEYSEWYERRLKVHRWLSYAELPLFGLQVYAGQKVLNGESEGGWKTTHNVGAVAISSIFGVNTVTGLWNLWDSRKDPEGRARRWIHALIMLSADAGFAYTATLGFDGGEREHRTAAYTSMGIATVGTVYMWLTR